MWAEHELNVDVGVCNFSQNNTAYCSAKLVTIMFQIRLPTISRVSFPTLKIIFHQ